MLTQKSPTKFFCKICDYDTSNKKDYNKHLSTAKHLANTIGNNKSPDNVCDLCKKKYKSRNGLWKHKKKCFNENETKNVENEPIAIDSSSNELKILTKLVVELVKSNNDLQTKIVKSNNDLQKHTHDLQKDFQKQMIDVCEKIQSGNNNVINSHNNNKTFNLQFFLNEECKDAMNMSEFINSIQIKISDLENIGKVGYVEGISNIIIKELNDTQINKRPVHCSDSKRETLYIKEENKWEKDTEESKQMARAVHDINKKNYKLLTHWKDTQLNSMDNKSNQSENFINLVGEVYDGNEINVKRVIKKVAKHVVIDK